jgi:hypothetical protein
MKNNNLKDTLAQARAIHFAMHNGVISYEKAHELTKPLLDKVNIHIAKIARKSNQKPQKLVFQDLGRNL